MNTKIESQTFRRNARRNCIEYMEIPIYAPTIPHLIDLHLPSFTPQTSTGAVSQLFATLVNMQTQINAVREGRKIMDAKSVPGVGYGDIASTSLNLSGDVYFTSIEEHNAFIEKIEGISTKYGWYWSISSTSSTSVYSPQQAGLTNADPIQSAIKGMVAQSFSDLEDSFKTITVGARSKDSVTPREKMEYYAAKERLAGSSVYETMRLQYYLNTPLAVQNKWAALPSENSVKVKINNVVVGEAPIKYVPTAITAVPDAYVMDNTGMYPTKYTISIQMQNPLGGLLANYSQSKSKDSGSDMEPLVPKDYVPVSVQKEFNNKYAAKMQKTNAKWSDIR